MCSPETNAGHGMSLVNFTQFPLTTILIFLSMWISPADNDNPITKKSLETSLRKCIKHIIWVSVLAT